MQRHWSQTGLMVSIGITLILVLGFLGESMNLFSNSISNQPVTLLCVNPECDKDYEISRDEVQEMIREDGENGMAPMMEQPRFRCKFCDEQSAYTARKCKKCETIFIPDYSSNVEGYPDTCPECGYSRTEEERR